MSKINVVRKVYSLMIISQLVNGMERQGKTVYYGNLQYIVQGTRIDG